MTTQTQTQTQLLIERLQLWDLIDECVDRGNLTKAIEMSRVIRDNLNPNIRRGYGL